MKIVKYLLLLLLAFIQIACGTLGGGSAPVPPAELPSARGPAGSYVSSSNLVSLESLSSSLLWNFNPSETPSTATENCTVTDADSNVISGTCINPINITGYALNLHILDLGGTVGTGSSGPARLFAGDTTTGERWGYAEYNLADPIEMRGTPGLIDFNDSYRWDHVSLETNNIDVMAYIKSQYWHVRMVFTSSPLTLETSMQTCGIESGLFDELETDTRYLSDTVDFYRGDIVLCKKDAASETCDDGDWYWYDLDLDQLTNTRPANPLQHDWTNNEVSCSVDGQGRPSINEGHYDLIAETDPEYELNAEIRDSCDMDFTYINPDTLESSTGNSLNAEFDYDMIRSIILPSISNAALSATSDFDILNAFIFKQMLIRNSFDDPDAIVDGIANLSSSATISVTEDADNACYE